MKLEKKHNFRVQEFPSDGSSVLFLFTAMGFKIWHYRIFIKLLNNKGFSVVVYDYPARLVLNPNFGLWQQFFDDMHSDVSVRIQRFKSDGKTSFGAYGVSMGSLFANKSTRDFNEITHVILNLTYGDVADNIWDSPMTRKTRKNLRAAGLGKTDLSEAVKSLNPVENAAGLRRKKVMLYLARRDRVLAYRISRSTKLALEREGVQFEYFEHKYLGHVLAGTKNLFYINKITEFYCS